MPTPTDNELLILDHIDQLTTAMAEAVDAGDGEAFLDALDESQFADRRLSASRENTWALWFSKLRATHSEVAA
ncbi:hypothetical protein HOV03_gp82 [Gordonia phage Asapag]|uniref:Uncharacterized protein n=1 Tax=Gordonia phage Asapag TaxID=2507862 RepID=A0A410TDX6_9CAUD|nr:hypothetical protein HOV03_gp82 [Gordonia phage Asapag]QAU07222.1 hypothetical protein SEA_ASAPAG_82 [Gordonia phage Asapag]